jgi:hypothetical protein
MESYFRFWTNPLFFAFVVQSVLLFRVRSRPWLLPIALPLYFAVWISSTESLEAAYQWAGSFLPSGFLIPFPLANAIVFICIPVDALVAFRMPPVDSQVRTFSPRTGV